MKNLFIFQLTNLCRNSSAEYQLHMLKEQIHCFTGNEFGKYSGVVIDEHFTVKYSAV